MYNQSLFLLGFLTSWATFNDPLFFGRFPRCLIDCPRLFPKRSDWISHVVYIYIYSYIAKYNKDINKYKQRTGRLYSTSQLKIVNNSSLYCKDLTMTKRRHESSLKAFTTYKLIHLLSLYFSGETFVCMTIGEWHPANAKGQRYYKAPTKSWFIFVHCLSQRYRIETRSQRLRLFPFYRYIRCHISEKLSVLNVWMSTHHLLKIAVQL